MKQPTYHPLERQLRRSAWRHRLTRSLMLKPIYQGLLKPNLYQRLTAAGRTRPDYIVLGAMRAASTTLHHLLSQHPEVRAGVKKEVHYFDLHYKKGERWYRAHFPRIPKPGEPAGWITGEATPYYLFHPAVPGRMRADLPETRLIVMLRDPVERAQSHYWHSVTQGFETLSMEAAFERETNRLSHAEKDHPIQDKAGAFSHQHHSYLARGRYAEQLERWFDHYPRDQFLILEQRAFFLDPSAGQRCLNEFLGIDPGQRGKIQRLNRRRYPPMAEGTRRKLASLFLETNEALFDLLGVRYDWTI